MIRKEKIKALAFDFGGTIDSPFLHWMDVYLLIYSQQLGLPLHRENFREAYIFAEREMERQKLVQPCDGLTETQRHKARLQFGYLYEKGVISQTTVQGEELHMAAARVVAEWSAAHTAGNKPVLERLARRWPLHLVSNYYGNLRTVVEQAGLLPLFESITDSTVVGLRKPDPALWQWAFNRAGLRPEEVLVVGDSAKNDILPALSLGCQAVKCCATPHDALPQVTCIYRLEELISLLL